MSNKVKQLQEFTIKGELIAVINLTDPLMEVKKIVEHEESHNFHFINNKKEFVSSFDLFRINEKDFPITVIKAKRVSPGSGDFIDEFLNP